MAPHPSADYIYDFGDYWHHKIQLDKILPREKNISYPVCIKGKRTCPPKDCGGIGGYERLLDIIKDPKHEEHKETLEWLGEEFDPEHFDPIKVNFDDPAARLKMALEPA
ncbi:MAG: plasmid pRiA4b ORF-3 family protein [Candidatus Methanoperedenaceae archaeon]|nr:plasmid pRiA4b ORF-3 family protein [Candidatus Methanoperedenaceae archaeon]